MNAMLLTLLVLVPLLTGLVCWPLRERAVLERLNLLAFGIIAALDTKDRPNDQINDYAGLWNTHPVLAGLMTIFLLSLGGFPPMVGFIGKWYVFSAAVRSGYVWLAIIGVLTSVVSVFFYLRVVVMMYMTPNDRPADVPVVPGVLRAALFVSAAIVLYLGILPTRVLDWAAASIRIIF